MPQLNYVLFDLDGTLFETALVDTKAYQQAFTQNGLPLPTAERICAALHLSVDESVRALLPSPHEHRVPRIAEDIVSLELDLIKQYGRLYDGVVEMLERTSLLDIPLGLCSNGPSSYVECVLREMGIRRFFQDVVPHQAGLSKRETVARMLPRIRRFALVGDSISDEEAALRNGGIFIGVRYGYGSFSQQHAYIAHSPQEIGALITRIHRG